MTARPQARTSVASLRFGAIPEKEATMELITDEQRIQLLHNGGTSRQAANFDPMPVVKLFTPDAGATWLLTELDPQDEDLAFGLCDLGMGCPELGYVRISELAELRGPLGLPVERDLHFTAMRSLSEYTRLARAEGVIRT